MKHRYLPGDEVILNDGRAGVLYAQTPNSRNPMGRDLRRQASWLFIPDARGAQGVTVISQPCTVAESEIARKTGHRAGTWPEPGHVVSWLERQRIYVRAMEGA